MTFHRINGVVCICALTAAIGVQGIGSPARGAEIDALWSTEGAGCLNLGHDEENRVESATVTPTGEGLLPVATTFDGEVSSSGLTLLVVGGEPLFTCPGDCSALFDAIQSAMHVLADGPTILAVAAGVVTPDDGGKSDTSGGAAQSEPPPDPTVRLAGYRPAPRGGEKALPKAPVKNRTSSQVGGGVGLAAVATIHEHWWNDVLEFKADSRGAELPTLRR